MKMLMFILMMAMAPLAYAADTPTMTVTLTSSPTPTFTMTPVALLPTDKTRDIIMPTDVLLTDGITRLGVTAVEGTEVPWLAMPVSQTAFAMSTPTSKARFNWVVPANYRNGLAVWAYASTSVTPAVFTMALNVAVQPKNGLKTALTAYLGPDTLPLSQGSGKLDLPLTKVSRFQLSLSNTASSALRAGDLVGFDLQRTGGGVNASLYIYAIELEYRPLPGRLR
jgi:hypothetical protein